MKGPYFISARPDGLGSRIISLINCLRLAKMYNGIPLIFWPDEIGHCSQDSLNYIFSENQINHWSREASPFLRFDSWLRKSKSKSVFVLRENFVSSSEILNQEVCFLANGNDAIIIDGENKTKAICGLAEVFRDIELNKNVIDLVKGAKSEMQFSSNFVGMQIRRGDMAGHKSGFKRCAPITCYENIIDSNLNKAFYVSTDSLDCYNYLKIKYGSIIHRMPIQSFNRNKEDLCYAMSELLILSETSEIYSGNSAFSKAASLIGATNLTVFSKSIERPE